jgi:hypothetical protein
MDTATDAGGCVCLCVFGLKNRESKNGGAGTEELGDETSSANEKAKH